MTLKSHATVTMKRERFDGLNRARSKILNLMPYWKEKKRRKQKKKKRTEGQLERDDWKKRGNGIKL